MARAPETSSEGTRRTGRKAAAASQQHAQKASNAVAQEHRRGPTHDEIARRAYELYLARGSRPGHQDEDWLQAERELRLGRY